MVVVIIIIISDNNNGDNSNLDKYIKDYDNITITLIINISSNTDSKYVSHNFDGTVRSF